jgi:flagellin-specific chaperone FliS
MLYHRTLEQIGESMGKEKVMMLFELAEEFWRQSKEVIVGKDIESKEKNNG